MEIIIIFTVFFVFGGIDCQTVTITKEPASVSVGQNITLICSYNGSTAESGVKWYNGSDTTGFVFSDTCSSVPGPSSSYDQSRIFGSCDSAGNMYRIKVQTSQIDNDVEWCCSFLFPLDAPIFCISKVKISLQAAKSESGDAGLSTGAIVGIVIGAVVFVAIVVVVIICLVQKCNFNKSSDVKNKTGGTNDSGNRNPTKEPQEKHAANITPNNANSKAIKPLDQSERRPLPQGPLPSLLPRNVNQPLYGEQQNFEELKKKKKKLKKKQKDEGTTEEGKAREG